MRCFSIPFGLAVLLVSTTVTPAVAAIVFGTDNAGGGIYSINVEDTITNADATFVTTTLADRINSLAWDRPQGRLFYAASGQATTHLPGTVFVWDQSSDTHHEIGPVSPSNKSNATFYNGGYYFVDHQSDNLFRADFDFSLPASPSIESVTKIADINGSQRGYSFGDIAFDADGVLYGIGVIRDSNPLVTEFFSYDLGSGTFTSIHQELSATYPALQLAFAGDQTLYGALAGPGDWFILDRNDGSRTSVGTIDNPLFSDLAGAAVPEPSSVVLGCIGLVVFVFAARRFRSNAPSF